MARPGNPRPNHISAAPVSRLLTVRDVAERLQVSTRTVNRLLTDGTIKVTRIGRSVRITEEALHAFLTEGDST